MIIFPRQITAEQMGFSFEFLVARIIFALGRTFQNLEKKTKIYLPSIPSHNKHNNITNISRKNIHLEGKNEESTRPG